MRPVWKVYRRYIFISVVLAATFLFLGPFHTAISPDPLSLALRNLEERELRTRLARSTHLYNEMLHERQDLIKKFGPTSKDIELFPQNVLPWPPYTVWDFFPPSFNCPHELQRVGTMNDGGKWVCGLSRVEQKPDCVVYSFGIGFESSFEAEILNKTQGCQIWGYDPGVKSFGPQISPDSEHSNRTHFHPFRLANSDRSHPAQDQEEMYTLASLMKMNGHTHIDILKIDIEGPEFETLAGLIEPHLSYGEPLPFGQLQLEIHLWDITFEQFLRWWVMLEAAGLRPFSNEPNLVYLNFNRGATPALAEYSFLNIKGSNIFINN